MTGRPPAGLLPVDKPEGPTSHDIVADARRALGVRRIGHTGTLDPFASGLLLLCIGWATRLAEYLAPLAKRYLAVATLGRETDTDDGTGQSLATSEAWRGLDPGRVRQAFEAHVGPRLQLPPRYSAKKVGGERMYRLARHGVAVQAEPVLVVIDSLRVRRVRLPHVTFEVECSTGTYIRAIARDVGRELGCGAHLRSLRRTAIGPHDVANALPARRLSDPQAVREALLPPLAALAHLPAVQVDEEGRRAIAHGGALPASAAHGEGLLALVYGDELLAVAEQRDGRIRPRKVFARD